MTEPQLHTTITSLSRAPNEVLAGICSALFEDGRWACDLCFGDESRARSKPVGEETYHDRFFDTKHAFFHIQESFWGTPALTGAFRNRKDDIYNFRLVCRRFAAIGAHFTHRSISLGIQDEGYHKLDQIASHPELGSCVRELKYYTGSTYAGWKERF